MPEVVIDIGGRSFEVACQEGEEHFLQSAARMLDREAASVVEATGRIPEGRMLLMAGLMLADRTAGMEDKLRAAEEHLDSLRREIEMLRTQPKPEPERVEVPVVPESVSETLAELAARAESIAETVREKTKG